MNLETKPNESVMEALERLVDEANRIGIRVTITKNRQKGRITCGTPGAIDLAAGRDVTP